MNCIVYKGELTPQTFLFVPDEETLEQVPDTVLERMGVLQKVMEFELTAERKLARTTAETVITSIRQQGFYLQLPPPKEPSMARYLNPVRKD